MTKKIFMILVIVLALFSVQKTYAMTEEDEINLEEKEKLETLIEINEGGKWKDLEIFKYNENNGIIYKLGSNEGNNNITISEEIQDIAIITILANGYGKKDVNTLGVSNSNEAYIATKIALDCSNNGIDKDDLQNYFRVKENLESPLKENAENIINAVKKLLSITKKNYFDIGFSIEQKGNIELDEFNADYCSQKYTITTNNCVPKKYIISDYKDFVSEVFSTNNEGLRKDTFTIEEDDAIFRIVMPKEYREVAFEGRFQFELVYEKSVVYFGKNGDNRYIILTDKEEKTSVNVYLLNKRSSISITVRDKDKPSTVIENVKVKVKDENNLVNETYTSNSRGSIFVINLGKGNVQMEVLEIPENYILEKSLYNKNLDYCEYCEYDIHLKYKKGSLHINDNAKGAIFEIYDKNSVYIGTYQTDEDGQIQIDEINIGEDYILKQVSVPDGYNTVEDSKFSILYNETTNINIINEEIIKENPNEEEEDNTNSSNSENSNLTSVGNESGQVEDSDGKEEKDQEQEDKKEIPNIEEEENKKEQSKEEHKEQYELEKQEQEEIQDKIDKVDKIDQPDQSDKVDELEKQEQEEIQDKRDKSDQIGGQEQANNQENNQENGRQEKIVSTLNKLPRTGYDFPEIKPWYLIIIIFILLYILKRTAKSQSK